MTVYRFSWVLNNIIRVVIRNYAIACTRIHCVTCNDKSIFYTKLIRYNK